MTLLACVGQISKNYVTTVRNVKYSSIGGCALFSGMFAVKLGVNTNLLTTYGSDINELQCGLITRGKKTLHTGEYRPVFPRNLSEVSLDSSGDKVKLTIINIGKMSTCSTSICIFQSGVGAKYISGAIVYNMAPNIEGGDIVGSKIYLCHPNAYLLCPTMDEFAEDVTKSIRDCDPLSIISLDAQGCVRKVASNGHEYYAEWRNVARHLKYLDIIKMNEFEAQYAFGFSTIREVNRKNWYHVLHSVIDKIGSMAEQYNKRLIFMITLGSDGMLVGIGKWHLAYIEPFKVNEVDPFGAGDSCHVAFVKKLIDTGGQRTITEGDFDKVCQSAMYSSAAGALAVQEIGFPCPFSEDDIYKLINRNECVIRKIY